ncbi:hypothetical protein EV368DRAFT_89814 [Lentinula lateritia]|nr:hypothetical protein EV368DRAFT_89814 [Lentinula lateritia]
MPTSSLEAVSESHPVASPPPTPSPHSNPPFATGEVDIDKLASSVEDPPLGQLTMFKSVLASVFPWLATSWTIPCGPSLPPLVFRAPLVNCDDKKPCILGQLARFRYFAHECSCDLSYAQQWRTIANKIESSTSSTRVLLELSPLDDQDWLEEDRLELQDFVCRQPKFPAVEEPIQSGPRRSPAPSKVSSINKKRKRTVWVGEASSSKRYELFGGCGATHPESWGRSEPGLPSVTISWGPFLFST